MPISKLAHFSIRTVDVEASKRFYIEVLGFIEGYRPPFNFPGAWLYRGGDEEEYGIVHIIGQQPGHANGLSEYLGARGAQELRGGAAVDHLAFFATDLGQMQLRLRDQGVSFRERTVPGLGLHQVFFEDPSGVTIELNFPAQQADTSGSLAAPA